MVLLVMQLAVYTLLALGVLLLFVFVERAVAHLLCFIAVIIALFWVADALEAVLLQFKPETHVLILQAVYLAAVCIMPLYIRYVQRKENRRGLGKKVLDEAIAAVKKKFNLK